MKNLVERSFAGQVFRPQSRVMHESGENFAVVTTSWGSTDEAEKIMQLMLQQMKPESGGDLTQPAASLPTEQSVIHQMRTTAILANEYLFGEVNQAEYLTAVEFLALSWADGVLSWVQVGSPSLLIQTGGLVQPLAYQISPSWLRPGAPPLPAQAMGLEKNCHFNSGSLKLAPEAEILLLSRNSIPSKLFQASNLSLPEVTKILVADSTQEAFWAASFQI